MTRIQATMSRCTTLLLPCLTFQAQCTTGVSSMDLNMVTSTAKTMYATAPHSLRAPWRASQRASHVAHPEQHGVFSPCWGRGDAVRTTRMAARRARRRSPLTCFPAPHRAHSRTYGPQALPTRSAGPLSVQDELRRPPSLRKAWTPPSHRSSTSIPQKSGNLPQKS